MERIILSLLFMILVNTYSFGASEIGPFTIIKAVDGDTVIVKNKKLQLTVHLAGIKTPPLDRPGSDSKVKEGGDSYEYLQRYAKWETEVMLEVVNAPKKLKNNDEVRAMVIQERGGVINYSIIDNGWSVFYVGEGAVPEKYYDTYLSKHLRNYYDRKGIWLSCPEWASRVNRVAK